MVREASTRLVADKNRTVTSAQLFTVPPSQADSRYGVFLGAGRPDGESSDRLCTRRAVPPAPPAKILPRLAGHAPSALGKPAVPGRTTVGSPVDTCQRES
jgi:hypothetical protein